MTGFGRTGGRMPIDSPNEVRNSTPPQSRIQFACHKEGVQPDFLSVAKGLTGGYLPMAATLTTQKVFDAFLGDYDEFKTFFHGHSYTANQLGAAAALGSLDLTDKPASIRARQVLEGALCQELQTLWSLPNVGDIRQEGVIAGVELVKDWRTRARFSPGEQVGIRVCEAMAERGVLTRPIGDVIVLMPPYCTTPRQVRKIVGTHCAMHCWDCSARPRPDSGLQSTFSRTPDVLRFAEVNHFLGHVGRVIGNPFQAFGNHDQVEATLDCVRCSDMCFASSRLICLLSASTSLSLGMRRARGGESRYESVQRALQHLHRESQPFAEFPPLP